MVRQVKDRLSSKMKVLPGEAGERGTAYGRALHCPIPMPRFLIHLFLFLSKHNQTSSFYLIQQVQLQLIVFIRCASNSTFEMREICYILIAERIELLDFSFGVSFLA